MAAEPKRSFVWGAGGSVKTPEEIAADRAAANKLLAAGMDYSPVGHWSQGLARVAQALLGGYEGYLADEATRGVQKERAAFDDLVSRGVGGGLAGDGGTAAAALTGASQGTAPVKIGQSQTEFVNAITPTALEVSRQTGIDPRIIISQAALESAWGKSAPGNNLFGIKSHGLPGGNTLATTEVINGQPVRTTDSFRAYGSPEESVRGYGQFMLDNPRYRELRAAQGLDAQIAALGRSGYATDPNYAAKIAQIARALPGFAAAAAGPDPQAAPAPAGVTGVPAASDPLAPAAAAAAMAGQPFNPEPLATQATALGGAPAGPAPAVAAIAQAMTGQAQSAPTAGAMWGGANERPLPAPTAAGMAAVQGGGAQTAPAAPSAPAAANPMATPYMRGLAAAMNNPRLTEQQRATAKMLWQNEMQRNDPMRQLQIENLRGQIAQRANPPEPDTVRALRARAEAAGLQPGTPQYQQFMLGGGKADGGVEYGLSPIYGTDASGNPVIGTLGKDGSFKAIDTGGVKIQTGVEKIDLGTQWGMLDKRSGNIVGYAPKDIAGAEKAKVIGEAEGKAAASARSDIQAGQNALDLLDKIEKHPYLERGTGLSSLLNVIPGTGGYDFSNIVEQAKSGAFLSAIQQMRGMGSLSNAEGQTATAAVNRMNTATSMEAFLDAVRDYRKIITQGMERARGHVASPSGSKVDDLLKKYGGS